MIQVYSVITTTVYLSRHLAACALLLLLSACSDTGMQPSVTDSSALQQQAPVLYSFEQAVPQNFLCGQTPASCLSLSRQSSKDGRQALKWGVGQAPELTLALDIDLHTTASDKSQGLVPAFYGWIYNPAPQNKALSFRFFQGGKEQRHFSFNLNFTGWRAVLVPYLTGMQGQGQRKLDQLVIQYPDPDRNTYLLFDHMAPAIAVDARWPLPDYQIKVHPHVVTEPNAHWNALLHYDDLRHNAHSAWRSQPPFQRSCNDEVQLISTRIDQTLLSAPLPGPALALTRLNVAIAARQNTAELDQPGQWLPIIMVRQHELLTQGNLNPDQKQLVSHTTMTFQQAGQLLLDIAKLYRQSLQEQQQRYLAAQFISLLQHLRQQGFVLGSGQGNLHHQGYALREWADAIFLMRDKLTELKPVLAADIAWLVGLGRIYQPQHQIDGFNVDVMNTFLPAMLYSVLLDTAGKQQCAELAQLSHWMDVSLLQQRGLAGGIQPDGAFFHHAQHYVAYGNGGLTGLTPVLYYLSKTAFQLSDAAQHRVKQALLKSRIFSNDGYIPLSLSGRHPDGEQSIAILPFYYMAKAMAVTTPDRELAAAYLALNKDPDDPRKKEFAAAGLSAAPLPQGAWVMNSSSLLLYRQHDWLLSARGFNRYLVSHESYQNANLFGRYLNYGQLEITPAQAELRAFRQAGWNWNRWPGTTSLQLPLAQLRARLSQVDAAAGVEEMLLSEQIMSSANLFNSKAAMFALSLRGHPKYDASFAADKSVFVFDHKVIALGSGIRSQSTQGPVQTTLFQISAEAEKLAEPIRLNGMALAANQLLSPAASSGATLTDHLGNHYIVPPGQQLHLVRQQQRSRDNKDTIDTQGEFVSAWIDHGVAPQSGTYQYEIDLQTAESAKQRTAPQAGSPTYLVRQQDDVAHIVEDKSSAIWGIAVFQPNQPLRSAHLLQTDKPALVMLRYTDELQVSVVNPDLALYEGKDSGQYDQQGQLQEVSIYSRHWANQAFADSKLLLRFAGRWQIATGTFVRISTLTSSYTEVELTTSAGQPVTFTLSPLRPH